MKKFKLSVQKFRERQEQMFGYVSDALVKEYAEARAAHKKAMKDLKESVFTDCPKCDKKKQIEAREALKRVESVSKA